jgi:hypothetical protein
MGLQFDSLKKDKKREHDFTNVSDHTFFVQYDLLESPTSEKGYTRSKTLIKPSETIEKGRRNALGRIVENLHGTITFTLQKLHYSRLILK